MKIENKQSKAYKQYKSQYSDNDHTYGLLQQQHHTFKSTNFGGQRLQTIPVHCDRKIQTKNSVGGLNQPSATESDGSIENGRPVFQVSKNQIMAF